MTISSAPLRKLAIGHLYEAKNQGAFRWRNWVLSVVQCNRSCGLRVALGESGKTERQVALIVIVIVRRVRNLQPATHSDFPCANRDRGQTCPAEKENKKNAFCKAQLATRNCGCIARLKEPCCAIGTTLDFWLHTDGRWPAYAEGLTR